MKNSYQRHRRVHDVMRGSGNSRGYGRTPFGPKCAREHSQITSRSKGGRGFDQS